MFADFRDAAAVEDDDLVGAADCGEAMGDDDDGAVLHQSLQCLLDEDFGFGVEVRCRFVKDEDRCVFEERSGDGEALALAK